MARAFICVLILGLLAACGGAPHEAPVIARAAAPGDPRQTSRYWLDQSEQLLSDLLSDEQRIRGHLHAVFLGRLCAAYWQTDLTRARIWCNQAVDEITRAGL